MDIHAAQIESNLPGEDRFHIKRKHNILACCVLDGHGGYLAVDIAVSLLLDLIIDKIHIQSMMSQSAIKTQNEPFLKTVKSRQYDPTAIVKCIDESFVEIDMTIRDYAIVLQNENKRKQQNNMYDFGAIDVNGLNATHASTSKLNHSSAENTRSSVRLQSCGTNASLGYNSRRAANQRSVIKPFGFAGCCVVVLVILEGMMYVAHVGDCRAVLVENSVLDTNNLIELTTHNSPSPAGSFDSTLTHTAATHSHTQLNSKPTKYKSKMKSPSKTLNNSNTTLPMNNSNNNINSDIYDAALPNATITVKSNVDDNCNGNKGHFFDTNITTIDYALDECSNFHTAFVKQSFTTPTRSSTHCNSNNFENSYFQPNLLKTPQGRQIYLMSTSDQKFEVIFPEISTSTSTSTSIIADTISNNNNSHNKRLENITFSPNAKRSKSHHKYQHDMHNEDHVSRSSRSSSDISNSNMQNNYHVTTSAVPNDDVISVTLLPPAYDVEKQNKTVSSSTLPPPAPAPPVYTAIAYYLRALTLDHRCACPHETKLVIHRSSDPEPFRRSTSDQTLRVAGSLAITRALGDGYLKTAELSLMPYKDHVPYITCRPMISYRALRPTDKAIILSTDGLWDYMTTDECLSTIVPHLLLRRKSSSKTTPPASDRNTYTDDQCKRPTAPTTSIATATRTEETNFVISKTAEAYDESCTSCENTPPPPPPPPSLQLPNMTHPLAQSCEESLSLSSSLSASSSLQQQSLLTDIIDIDIVSHIPQSIGFAPLPPSNTPMSDPKSLSGTSVSVLDSISGTGASSANMTRRIRRRIHQMATVTTSNNTDITDNNNNNNNNTSNDNSVNDNNDSNSNTRTDTITATINSSSNHHSNNNNNSNIGNSNSNNTTDNETSNNNSTDINITNNINSLIPNDVRKVMNTLCNKVVQQYEAQQEAVVNKILSKHFDHYVRDTSNLKIRDSILTATVTTASNNPSCLCIDNNNLSTATVDTTANVTVNLGEKLIMNFLETISKTRTSSKYGYSKYSSSSVPNEGLGTGANKLLKMPQGMSRRQVMDDVTILVVVL